MGCDSPSVPASPDYVGAAQAQGQANWQTALANAFASNPNVNTPYGSQRVTWNQMPSAGGQPAAPTPAATTPAANPLDVDPITGQPNTPAATPPTTAPAAAAGTPEYERWQATIDQTLSPEQQALYDQSNRINQNLGGIAEAGLDRVGGTLGTAYDPSSLPGRVSNIQSGQLRTGPGGMNLDAIQKDMAGYFSGSKAGDVTREINTGGTLTRGEGNAATYTSPDGKTYQFDANSPMMLANASPEIMQDWQSKYGAQSRLQYGADLSKLSAMPEASDAARQSVTNALYGQMTSRLDPQWNQREEQNRNRLLQQGFTEGSTGFDRANENFGRERNDAYNTALNQAVMSGGEEMQRQYDMGMGARQQGWAEEAGNVGFNNAATQSLYGMGANDTSIANATQNQAFNQGLNSGSFTNAARGQQLSEDLAMRQLPLNELNSLRTGTQLQNPSFPGFSGVNSQAGNIQGAAGQQGQWDTGVYNAQAGQAGQNASTLGQLGSAAMMASGCG